MDYHQQHQKTYGWKPLSSTKNRIPTGKSINTNNIHTITPKEGQTYQELHSNTYGWKPLPFQKYKNNQRQMPRGPVMPKISQLRNRQNLLTHPNTKNGNLQNQKVENNNVYKMPIPKEVINKQVNNEPVLIEMDKNNNYHSELIFDHTVEVKNMVK